jgi:hypothetical protein
MEARQFMRSPARDQENIQEPRVPRWLIRQAMAKCNAAGRLSVVSVSRLDAMRWHIRLSQKGCDSRKEIYISPEDGGVLYVTTTNADIHITLYGDLGEGCLRNLGDCLVKALCDDARYLDIWLGATTYIPAAAGSMLESLGRNLAQKNLNLDVTIHGPDQIVRMLTKAFVQGASHAKKRRGLS